MEENPQKIFDIKQQEEQSFQLEAEIEQEIEFKEETMQKKIINVQE